ncbi:MAG: 16S rRNA (uracil(1498)-N(3))-methyltransferase [Prevotella sp.]|jgi:16S rRNA (uracil1498-N3)-methyltransferase
MKEVRFFYVPQARQATELPEDESRHALRVLRLQGGDDIYLMDGEGTFYRAMVTLAAGKHCGYRIEETLPQEKTWNGRIHLAIAPTKMIDRIEWMLEKATEIGFDEATMLHCRFSERKHVRIDRLDKIVISAMKQSRKAWKPVVNDLTKFKEFVERPCEGRKFICHCYNEIEQADLYTELQSMSGDEPVTVLVGPEGDFSTDEVRLAMANGYESVTLGHSRLRTETAGLMAVTMAHLSKRKS